MKSSGKEKAKRGNNAKTSESDNDAIAKLISVTELSLHLLSQQTEKIITMKASNLQSPLSALL